MITLHILVTLAFILAFLYIAVECPCSPFVGIFLCFVFVVGIFTYPSYTLGTRNVEDVKAHAPKVWQDAGMEVVGYEGYYHDVLTGGVVQHTLRKTGKTDILYHGQVSKWKSEYHYTLTAIDAIKP